MGAVAALLAGACVAPVVIQVVLFSSNLYATGTHVALALPFVLGIGMAMPWPFAGAGMAALPKPGAWMVRVKQAFGVFILATAAYYGYLAYTLFAEPLGRSCGGHLERREKLKEGWHSSLAEGLETAPPRTEAGAHRPVGDVVQELPDDGQDDAGGRVGDAALSGYVKIKFQAEDPDEPTTKAIMQRFKAVGLPTYVILRPKSAGAMRVSGLV